MDTKDLREKKIKRLVYKLGSDRELEITEALKELRGITTSKSIEPVIQLLNNENERVTEEAKYFLLDLKKEEALPPIISSIKKEKNTEVKNFLISLLWNTPLNPDEHLIFLVELLNDSNYMTKVEVMTVIENLQGPFSNEEKEEAIFSLHEILQDDNSEEDKMLFHQIEKILKELATEEY